MSSNRPELVALRECLETHPDNENLLYLSDSETTLQAINKWIGGGAKLSLAKTEDADILRAIIVKLQQRVKVKAATLLIKVKAHHGCPLNEEADIRAEMGRMKQEQEKTWSTPTSRSIYQWSESSKNKRVINTTKQTACEKGVEKWRQEHMPRKGKGNISAEGQELLEDKEIWGNETALHRAVYESRKRERSNEDRLFMPYQKGPITSTFTADWFLREGQGRELLGEWMNLTSVRSQGQRRILRTNSHTFPTNAWIHKITKGKESDRCDLCRVLWIAEGRFRFAPEWKFLCVSGEKCLQTIWDDITSEFKDIPYLNLTQDTIWNVARVREMTRPLTPVEDRRIKEGIPKETVVKESFCRIRPDGIAVLPPVGNTAGIFCILEHKRMSDVCDRYLIRVRSTAVNQYASLRIFRVPEGSINSIYSKLAMRVFDVYANTLKCMYNTRFSGGAARSEDSSDAQPTPFVVTSLTHTIDPLPKPDNFKRRKESPEVKDK
jgi:ribonuclease HI